jgi:predicted RNase H-like nuclease (RuvC/YqgF family)
LTEPASVSAEEAARLLGIPEEEARELAGPDGRVPLGKVRQRLVSAEAVLELARAREEVGRLTGQLREVRAQNARLQREVKESVAERRRLVEEVLDLRAAAEERLMLMERVEQMARMERDLAEKTDEVGRLRNRGLLARLLNGR